MKMKRLKIADSIALGSSILTLVAPKFCCWGTALAAVSGGVSYLAWVYPMRPYLFALALVSLGYSFYKAYRPQSDKASSCPGCKTASLNFFQSKLWVWIMAVFVLTLFAINFLHHD